MPSSGTEGGPCSHCFRTQSCCWRRGPVSKPILCNACGSRYLVKKNLDGYKPLQQRVGMTARPPPPKPKCIQRKQGGSEVPATRRGADKPRRNAVKTLDAATWQGEQYSSEDSEGGAYLTDDSAAAAPSSSMYYRSEAGAGGRGRSLLGGAAADKVLRIATEAQLRELDPKVLSRLLRSKPRKQLNPTISVVF